MSKAMTQPTTDELIEQLYKIDGKAEIVNGRIVHMSPTGDTPSRIGGKIFASLLAHERQSNGHAYPDNAASLANLPHRKSFSPDASFYTGPRAGKKFLPQPPDFAAEVRSENDYGPAAERKIAEKRADYFAAGTKVVWDVDEDSDDVIRVYRFNNPDSPTIYRRGDTAEAEPAVPGWTIQVDELFD
jgi:Uma2 family endonuclease